MRPDSRCLRGGRDGGLAVGGPGLWQGEEALVRSCRRGRGKLLRVFVIW